MPYNVVNRTIPARVHLVVHHNGHKETGRKSYQSSTESRRCDADDRDGMVVEVNGMAHDARIVVKMRVPICIAEHHIRSAVWPILIRSVKNTAKIRLNTQ